MNDTYQQHADTEVNSQQPDLHTIGSKNHRIGFNKTKRKQKGLINLPTQVEKIILQPTNSGLYSRPSSCSKVDLYWVYVPSCLFFDYFFYT